MVPHLKHKALWITVGAVATALLVIFVVFFAFANNAAPVDRWGWINPIGVALGIVITAGANAWAIVSIRISAAREAAHSRQLSAEEAAESRRVAAVLAEEAKVVAIQAAKKIEEATRAVANQLVSAADNSAERAEQVRISLKETTETTVAKLSEMAEANVKAAEVGQKTYVLSNSNMAIQLKMNMDLSRWKSNETKNEADISAADLAEKMYKEHMQQQAVVDKLGKPH